MRKTNETYTIEVSSPLVRPGLKITTSVSKRYLVQTLKDLFEKIREFNDEQQAEKTGKRKHRPAAMFRVCA